MEMCYTGALVMPNNYVVVSEDEMAYLDGGTAKNFYNNLKGLWNKSETLRWAMRASGLSWGYIANLAYVSYWYVCANVAVKLGTTIGLVSRVFGAIAAMGVVAAATYVWNKRIWY